MIKEFINGLQYKIGKRGIAFNSHCKESETIFLSSMGRSGSTILSNIINHDNSYRILFEPFRYDIVNEAKDFKYPLYLKPNNHDIQYLLPAQKIISGKIHSSWIDKENRTIFPKGCLIKDIRTNLFLKWIHNNFPELKIILLLRHPCAVVSSWLIAGFGDGDFSKEKLLADKDLKDDIDALILKEYSKSKTPFEKLIFFWCISYWIPFKQFNINELHLVFYENLITDPIDELKSLFSFLDREYSQEKALKVLREPSSTTKKNKESFRKGEIKINGWRNKFTNEEIDRAYEIMSLFGMDTLYDRETSVPNIKVAQQLITRL
jgi:hypothetical protein